MRASKRVMDADRAVGRRLSALRRLQGVSQSTIAEAAGLTFQQVQKYENGTNRISCGKLLIFANRLGVPVGTFFEGLQGDLTAPPPEDFSDAALRAARSIMRLADEHAQREVGKVCNRMVEIMEEIGAKHAQN